MIKQIGLCVIIILTLVLTACNSDNKASSQQAPKVGQTAPDFELSDYNGTPLKLSDFKGRPILINFWATWCPPCKVEMPAIENIYQEYQPAKLAVLGVNIREDSSTIKNFIKEKGYSWQMLVDPKGSVLATYRVIGYPTSFFIDKSGTLRAIEIGGLDKTSLEQKLALIL